MANFVLSSTEIFSRLGCILADMLLLLVQLVDHLEILALT